jgi:hypothetical protein
MTADLMPFVGNLDHSLTGRKLRVPPKEALQLDVLDRPAEWISAGYCGEGMVSAWLCGAALALMVLGRGDVDVKDPEPGYLSGRLRDWFPDEFRIGYERVREANVVNLLEWWA